VVSGVDIRSDRGKQPGFDIQCNRLDQNVTVGDDPYRYPLLLLLYANDDDVTYMMPAHQCSNFRNGRVGFAADHISVAIIPDEH